MLEFKDLFFKCGWTFAVLPAQLLSLMPFLLTQFLMIMVNSLRQLLSGEKTVSVLRAMFLAFDGDPGGPVQERDARLNLIDILPPWPFGGTENLVNIMITDMKLCHFGFQFLFLI